LQNFHNPEHVGMDIQPEQNRHTVVLFVSGGTVKSKKEIEQRKIALLPFLAASFLLVRLLW
jgi:hypothetical protein